MAQRKRLRRFARNTLERLVKSDKTPEWLKEYWELKLKNNPDKKEFTIKSKRK
jgi:hypothetical protein